MKKIKIRIDPTKSPLKFIRKKREHHNLLQEEEVEIENEEETLIDINRHMDLLQKVQIIIDEEKHDEKQYKLLKMMYLDDIDAEYAVNKLDISENELGSIVEELVELGLLQFISDNEAEITEEGIKYIKSRDLKFEY